jgi:hypothetical protein
MANPLPIAAGDNLVVSEPAVHWEVEFSDTNPPSVVLTASLQAGPIPPTAAPSPTPTSLAIQMGAPAAMQLYGKLYTFIRSMGWLPEE